MKKRKIAVTEQAETITRALQKGAFLNTKAGEKTNSMVIGWGHVGRIWERDVFIAYVRESRYTRQLLDANPEFTVSVPIHGFSREAFAICGTKSGRDMDKIAASGLTLEAPEVISVPGIREFPLTLECRVVYRQKQDASLLPEDIRRNFYGADGSEHVAYYGEIVAAYLLEED